MWRGLYTAATGMISESKRTDVIASNLANAATTGYKRDVTVHREFHQMLIKRVNDHENTGALGVDAAPFNSLANLGTSKEDVTQIKGFSADPFYRPGIGPLGLGDYIDEVAVDYHQGAIESTGNAFDLAVAGDGFFAVQTPNGARYTRNGAFFKNRQGYLQDIRGNNLLDMDGNPIRIPANVPDSRVLITGDGTIYVPGQLTQINQVTNQLESIGNQDAQQRLAQIQLVEFGDRLATQKQGDNMFYLVNDRAGNPPVPTIVNQDVRPRITEPDANFIVPNVPNPPAEQNYFNAPNTPNVFNAPNNPNAFNAPNAQGQNPLQPNAQGENPLQPNAQGQNPQQPNAQGQIPLQPNAPGQNFQPRPASGEIIQGALEKSNTSIVTEMVELIHNHRLYEANAKAVTTQDSMLDNSVNQIGNVS